MTAPDKPLHERIAEWLDHDYQPGDFAAMAQDAEPLLREAAAELSRMRTALEKIRAMRRDALDETYPDYSAAFIDGCNQCAAIAERALTAGSGNE